MARIHGGLFILLCSIACVRNLLLFRSFVSIFGRIFDLSSNFVFGFQLFDLIGGYQNIAIKYRCREACEMWKKKCETSTIAAATNLLLY